MDKLPELLAALMSAGTLIAVCVFIVPGFISIRAYQIITGAEKRPVTDSLLDVLIASFATDVIWVPIMKGILSVHASGVAFYIAVGLLSLIGFVGTPILFAWIFYRVQTILARSRIVPDPIVKPWDKIFCKFQN